MGGGNLCPATSATTAATSFDGRQCGSPSLTGEHFCYYHHNTRGAAARAAFLQALASGYALPLPEDERSIQQSLHLVIQKLVTNQLDSKRAGLVLYDLQIAAKTTLPTERRLRAPGI